MSILLQLTGEIFEEILILRLSKIKKSQVFWTRLLWVVLHDIYISCYDL